MAYVTSFERLGIKKGREEGIKEGIKEGQQSGAAEIVLRQLKRKIGQFPPEIEQQISTLTLAQLEDLGDHLLSFSTLADLEIWLQLQKGDSLDS